MSKIKAALILMLICLSPLNVSAGGLIVSSNDLIDDAGAYDGSAVVYSGEVIGDIMIRGGHTWINVSDGSNAIGVWVDSEAMQGITLAGRYNAVGDTVKIAGTFYRACAQHGGDFDIHADSVEILDKGYAVSHAVQPIRLIGTILIWSASIALLMLVIRKNNRGSSQS